MKLVSQTQPDTLLDSRADIALPANIGSKTYRHHLDIFLKDSNAYGNTYFARYFEWQGICRESWFFNCIASDMLQSQGIFITKSAHLEYHRETFPFQSVDCELNTFAIRQCSFSLQFRFYNANELVCQGYQQLLFADHQRKISRLPAAILQKLRQYMITVN